MSDTIQSSCTKSGNFLFFCYRRKALLTLSEMVQVKSDTMSSTTANKASMVKKHDLKNHLTTVSRYEATSCEVRISRDFSGGETKVQRNLELH